MLMNDMHEDWDQADDDVRDGIVILKTDGDGYWSVKQKDVRVTELVLTWCTNDREFGSFNVHFNTDDWRPDRDGLIYTDDAFMGGLREYLKSKGYAGGDVDYSEQGMQGDNFVNCDVGKEFIASWAAKNDISDVIDPDEEEDFD